MLFMTIIIKETEALDNPLTGAMPKSTFLALCGEYEASPSYWSDERKACDENKDLIDIPKRVGKLPDRFDQLVEFADAHRQQGRLEETILDGCRQFGIKPMTELTFYRYLAKRDGGRGAMRTASFHYHKEGAFASL